MLSLPSWLRMELAVTAAPIANPVGGLTTAAAWMQQNALRITSGSGLGQDPSRWREIDHWQAHARLDLYDGQPDFSTRIGSLIAPQTIAYPPGLWFSGASLSRRNRDDSLRFSAGLLSLDQDFVVAPAYNAYLFSAINDSLNLNILGLPLSPFTTPGLNLRWRSGSFGEWRLGAYWLDPEIQLASLFGVDTGLPTVRGTVQILEWSYAPARLRDRYAGPLRLAGDASTARLLPPPLLQLGTFRSWVATSGPNAWIPATAAASGDSLALNRVAYGALTLPVTLPLGHDNRVWGAAQVGFDPASNPTPMFLAGGWLCQGPLQRRPQDVLALGIARTGFSAPLLPDLNWQAVVELNYTVRINTNLSLQPLLQWILNPAGDGRVPAILTSGVQLTLNF